VFSNMTRLNHKLLLFWVVLLGQESRTMYQVDLSLNLFESCTRSCTISSLFFLEHFYLYFFLRFEIGLGDWIARTLMEKENFFVYKRSNVQTSKIYVIFGIIQ
jgi:hypothetical protein